MNEFLEDGAQKWTTLTHTDTTATSEQELNYRSFGKSLLFIELQLLNQEQKLHQVAQSTQQIQISGLVGTGIS